jgi:hypothetical protein
MRIPIPGMWVFFALTVLIPGTAGPREAPQTVSLARSADLEAVVTALGRAGCVVVADVSTIRRTLREPLQEVPLDQALGRISLDFDRFVLRRGKTLVLQRRYSDPDEDAGLEIAELRAAAVDMDRLIQPFAPQLRAGPETIGAMDAFIAALTPEQEQRMLGGGLPFRELSARQQEMWLELNADQAYGTAVMELRRARLCFTQWERATLEDIASKSFPRRFLIVTFADPAGVEGKDGIAIQTPGLGPPVNVRGRQPRSEGVELPPAGEKPPARLRARWPLPVQQMDLETLAQKLREDGGPKLEIPTYARARTVWIVSNGGTRAEVLAALADLWGWELSPTRSGYALGRPRLAPARDAADLRLKLRRAVPPALRHMIVALLGESANERWARQMSLLVEGAHRVAGREWKRFPVTQLDEVSQRRLANEAALRTFGSWYSSYGVQAQPDVWLTNPERGIFKLSGPLGPGRHPRILFLVKDDRGMETGWGWSVGTAESFP